MDEEEKHKNTNVFVDTICEQVEALCAVHEGLSYHRCVRLKDALRLMSAVVEFTETSNNLRGLTRSAKLYKVDEQGRSVRREPYDHEPV